MHAAAAASDLFVFNGDTVDFKWTALPDTAETVKRAIDFLRNFVGRHSPCQCHVYLGNHDHIQPFMDALEALSARTPNLTWHPYYLRVGKSLFLHGDAANRKMSHYDLQRYLARWLEHRNKKQGKLKNRVYDAAFRANAHIAVSRLVFTPKRTMKRLDAYLDDIGQSTESGVEKVYFGHTHVPVQGTSYRGVTYHNGGAPMKGIPFRLLMARV
jgi:UDP-2,3-diacylglucosamine hydrolase